MDCWKHPLCTIVWHDQTNDRSSMMTGVRMAKGETLSWGRCRECIGVQMNATALQLLLQSEWITRSSSKRKTTDWTWFQKTWAFILLVVQSLYVASPCASQTKPKVLFHTGNTTQLVNNPSLQYQLHVLSFCYTHHLANHYKNIQTWNKPYITYQISVIIITHTLQLVLICII